MPRTEIEIQIIVFCKVYSADGVSTEELNKCWCRFLSDSDFYKGEITLITLITSSFVKWSKDVVLIWGS